MKNRYALQSVFFIVVAIVFSDSIAWGKSSPTLHSREEISRVRKLCQTESWAKALCEQAEKVADRWLKMSDQQLWDFVPTADMIRAGNVNYGRGCPVHGEEIYRSKGGRFPWIMDSNVPFKVKCPVGGEMYPSNDYDAYLKSGRKEKLDTSKPYVDDGAGYFAPDGKRYFFVGYYIYWQRWCNDILSIIFRSNTGAMEQLSNAYLLSGDPKYAHKLGIILGKLIQVYPKMDYSKQAYHADSFPAGIEGGILDYVWENETINRISGCYDSIYDASDQDNILKSFLAERGIYNFKSEFEQKVLHHMANMIMEGRVAGNMQHFGTLSRLALVIDNNDCKYGVTTKKISDWLLYGPGQLGFIFNNGFDRDGIGGESAVGYSSMWNANICIAAEALVRLGVDITADSRWSQIIRAPYNMTVGGKFFPRIGDCGGDIKNQKIWFSPDIVKFGYKYLHDPMCAQVLLGQDVFGKSLWGDTFDRREVERIASSKPNLIDPCTRNMGGYGLAVFDSNQNKTRRTATMYYGSPNASHGHNDRLTISFTAHDRDFLTEMGYPAHWGDKADKFTKGMVSHYVVEIDKKMSNKLSGYLDFFAAGHKVKLARAHAEAIYPDLAQKYQRTFAMFDVGSESFLIDLFHVKGGSVHDYHFHGLPFGKFQTSGLELISTQSKGTFLGENIGWGEDKSPNPSGYDYLKNVRCYKANSVWSVNWIGQENCRLTYFMPAFDEVFICDGEPPLKPTHPKEMEFITVRTQGPETRFPAVIAPSFKKSIIKNVKFKSEDFITSYNVDTIEGVWDIKLDDDGGFSVILESKGKAVYGFFANKMSVEFAGQHYYVKQKPVFTIEEVDYNSNTIKVKEKIGNPARLIGQVCVIGPNMKDSKTLHSASFTVAKAGPHMLQFEGPVITGRIVIEKVDGKKVITKTDLKGNFGRGAQILSRNLEGMVLMTEDLKNSARITSYSSEEGCWTFRLEEPLNFLDSNNDGYSAAYFCDYAPGYMVTFSPWVEITQASDGTIDIQTNVSIAKD